MLKNILVVGLGSFIGGILRYLFVLFLKPHNNITYPYHTFLVNIIGSLILGFVVGYFEKNNFTSNTFLLFLSIGICGGFTTFSTFAFENYLLLKNGNYFTFALYSGASIFLGILFIILGFQINKINLF